MFFKKFFDRFEQAGQSLAEGIFGNNAEKSTAAKIGTGIAKAAIGVLGWGVMMAGLVGGLAVPLIAAAAVMKVVSVGSAILLAAGGVGAFAAGNFASGFMLGTFPEKGPKDPAAFAGADVTGEQTFGNKNAGGAFNDKSVKAEAKPDAQKKDITKNFEPPFFI